MKEKIKRIKELEREIKEIKESISLVYISCPCSWEREDKLVEYAKSLGGIITDTFPTLGFDAMTYEIALPSNDAKCNFETFEENLDED